MKQQELEREGGGSYVLALAAGIPDWASFVQEMREFKNVVMDWHARRGETGKEVVLMLVAQEEVAQEYLGWLARIHEEEVDLDAAFRHATLDVTVLTNGDYKFVRKFPLKD